MPEVATLSSTGEVKIPLKVRTRLGLQAGQKFVVEARGADVFLQRLGLPGDEQVAEFVAWTKDHQMPARFLLSRGTKPRRATSRKRGAKAKSARRSK